MNKRYIAKLKDKEAIGIDFDGTMAQSLWPKAGIGSPISGVKEALRRLKEQGEILVVYTARPWGDYFAIQNWLEDNDIVVDDIVCGKPRFKLYIGDEALRYTGKWAADVKTANKLLGLKN